MLKYGLCDTGTIYLTILVTVNRYVSVCWPYRASELCSIRSARLHVAAVVLFAVVFNLPRYFEYAIVYAPAEIGNVGEIAIGDRNSTAESEDGLPSIHGGAAIPSWNSTHLDSSNDTSTGPLELTYEATWLAQHSAYRLVYKNLLYFLVTQLTGFVGCCMIISRITAPSG